MATTCIKCGYERQATDTAPNYECPKCGVIYAKAAAKSQAITNGAAASSGKDFSGNSQHTSKKRFVVVIIALVGLTYGSWEGYKFFLKARAEAARVERQIGIDQLKAIETRWIDGYKLASSTSRIALSAPVQNLQTIARDLKSVKVSKCLAPAKALLGEILDISTDGFMEFMRKDEMSATLTLNEALKKVDLYRVAKNKCD